MKKKYHLKTKFSFIFNLIQQFQQKEPLLFYLYLGLFIYSIILMFAVHLAPRFIFMGDSYGYQSFHPFRPIGYGIFLKFIYIFSQDYSYVKIFQIAFYFFALGYLSYWLKQILPKKAFLVWFLFALLLAFNWDTLHYHYVLMTDSFLASFILLLLAGVIRIFLQPEKIRVWINFGVIVGLSLLFRPNSLPFFAIIFPIYILLFGLTPRQLLKPISVVVIILVFIIGEKSLNHLLNGKENFRVLNGLLMAKALMLATPNNTNPFLNSKISKKNLEYEAFNKAWQYYENKYKQEQQIFNNFPSYYCMSQGYYILSINYFHWSLSPWWLEGLLVSSKIYPREVIYNKLNNLPQGAMPYFPKENFGKFAKEVIFANKSAALKQLGCSYANLFWKANNWLFSQNATYINFLTHLKAVTLFNKKDILNRYFGNEVKLFIDAVVAKADRGELTWRDIVRYSGYQADNFNINAFNNDMPSEIWAKKWNFIDNERRLIDQEYETGLLVPSAFAPELTPIFNKFRFIYNALWILGFLFSWIYLLYFIYKTLLILLQKNTSFAEMQNQYLPKSMTKTYSQSKILTNKECSLWLWAGVSATMAQLYLFSVALLHVGEDRYLQPIFPLFFVILTIAIIEIGQFSSTILKKYLRKNKILKNLVNNLGKVF